VSLKNTIDRAIQPNIDIIYLHYIPSHHINIIVCSFYKPTIMIKFVNNCIHN
jgi:hypothetical protein